MFPVCVGLIPVVCKIVDSIRESAAMLLFFAAETTKAKQNVVIW